MYSGGDLSHNGAMSSTHAEKVRRRVEVSTTAGLGVAEYAESVLDLLREAVPYDAVCLATSDPATGLLTGRYHIDLGDSRDAEFAHLEYEVDDVNLFRDVAARPRPVGVLDLDTGGAPETSVRWREFLMPHFGIRHELRAAFRADAQVWGLIGMYRGSPASGFSPAEADFIAGLSDTVARGLRAAIVTSAATGERDHRDGPAVVIVGPDGTVRSATPAAQQHLADLGSADADQLPMPLHALVSATRAFRDGRQVAAPRTRIRLASGEWLVLHAAPLASADAAGGEVVVTMEPARPPDVVPLVVAAHGLTEREQDVMRLVLAGASTTEIGRTLHLSPYTVQDHMKSIFDKTGVRSRRELTAGVFFDQYAPRIGSALTPSGWFAS